MSDLLRIRPSTTPAMIAVYDDANMLRHALRFEAELARALAAAGLVTRDAAAAVAAVTQAIELDASALAGAAALAGTFAIPLVAQLRARLPDEAAAAVHQGATSQDLADSVMALQGREAAALLGANLDRICLALRRLAPEHAATPVMGRTLLQDAAPISFGLRLAQWLAGVESARARFERACDEALALQLGGAVGTRSGFSGKGTAVAEALAAALGLPCPAAPWHARRDAVANLGACIGILIGMLGKVARDISLLAQQRTAELREPLIEGRGGSSAMPHKRNPTGCQVALSAAARAPGAVAALIGALPQELERGLGGWQAEAPLIAELFMLADGSAAAMATVVEGLEVDRAAMARNLHGHPTPDLGESASLIAALLDQHGKAR